MRYFRALGLSVGLWAALGGGQGLVAQGSIGPIERCAEIRALNFKEAAEGRPVKVSGVVTLVPEGSGHGNYAPFILDDGSGVWVRQSAAAEALNLRVGDFVEVLGKALNGRFSPIVHAESIRVLGRRPLPAAIAVRYWGLNSGEYDCQRVTIGGVVQAAEVEAVGAYQELRLQVRSEFGPIHYALLTEQPVSADRLVNANVTLTGVHLSYFNSRRQYLGARIRSNDPSDIVVNLPGDEDPFAVPQVALSEVMVYSPGGIDLHRRRVRAVVTLSRPGEYFYLQTGRMALRVNSRQKDELNPGDEVEASGFFQMGTHRAEMRDAQFRKVGAGSPVAPIPITRDQAFTREPQMEFAALPDFNDVLVSLRGELVSLDRKLGEPLRLNLQCDGALVPAEFVGEVSGEDLAGLLPGTELEVTGVCEVGFSGSWPVVGWPQPVSVRLLVRGFEDVAVLRPASWWTIARLAKFLGAALFVIAASLAWIVSLRRTVVTRSRQLADEMRARRDAAVEFESSIRERNRLAADLHDTMEQSLTGLALQLEASQALQSTDAGRSKHHLGIARQLLGRSREDVRRSIWNLRANPLERQALAEALGEIAANRSAGLPISISVDCEGETRDLADFVAGNLLLLAQEGITNALKHGGAAAIELRLIFSPGTISLSIRDDGKGFDPENIAGPSQGHFGLQGMRERMKRLGGTLEIRSAPSAGATITATVKD